MSRFVAIPFDEKSKDLHQYATQLCEMLETFIGNEISDSRSRARALTLLEDTHVWIGKAIRDAQLLRGVIIKPNDQEPNDQEPKGD